MPFTVNAREFVPASATQAAMEEPTAMGAMYAGGDGHNKSGGDSRSSSGSNPASHNAPAKERVCMAFYDYGECPFGEYCEHAHHFTELSSHAQNVLLGAIHISAIPPHFFGMNAYTGPSPGSAAIARHTPCDAAWPHLHSSSVNMMDAAAKATTYVPWVPGSCEGDHGNTQTAPVKASTPTASLEQSLTSRTSSRVSTPPSAAPARSTPSTEGVQSFKMHLPQRCRYPHAEFHGTYYDVLSLPRDASEEMVLARYYSWRREGFKRVKQVSNRQAEMIDRMTVEARNVLGNAQLRVLYDKQLPKERTKGTRATAALPDVHDMMNKILSSATRPAAQSSGKLTTTSMLTPCSQSGITYGASSAASTASTLTPAEHHGTRRRLPPALSVLTTKTTPPSGLAVHKGSPAIDAVRSHLSSFLSEGIW